MRLSNLLKRHDLSILLGASADYAVSSSQNPSLGGNGRTARIVGPVLPAKIDDGVFLYSANIQHNADGANEISPVIMKRRCPATIRPLQLFILEFVAGRGAGESTLVRFQY